MSLRIPLDSFNGQQKLQIKKMLTFKPKKQFFKQNRYSKPEPPVKLWSIDKVVDKDDNELWFIRLPYFFALRYIDGMKINVDKKYFNHNKTYLEYPEANFKGSLYDHQIPVSEEVLQQLDEHYTSSVNVYTGFGKTVLGTWFACKKKLLTLVVLTGTTLLGQWSGEFIEFTNFEPWIIDNGKRKMRKFMSKFELGDNSTVIICMIGRLGKIPLEIRKKIGLLIIDEAHTFCTQARSEKLLDICPKYIISFTATPVKENGLETVMYSLCGKHNIVRISTKPFDVIKFRTNIEFEETFTPLGVDFSDLLNKMSRSDERNKMIVYFVMKNPKHKILILTRRREHTMRLTRIYEALGQSVDYMDANKKVYKDSRILIGTINKLGTGFDEKAACKNFGGVRLCLLLLVVSVKSLTVLEQTVGRVLRSSHPQVVHFIDDNKCIQRHWSQNKKWYKSRNGTIMGDFRKNSKKAKKAQKDSVNYEITFKGDISFNDTYDNLDISETSVGSTSTSSSTSASSSSISISKEPVKNKIYLKLKDRLDLAKSSGKVLDITNLDEDGNGTRIIKKVNFRSKKYIDTNDLIVTSNVDMTSLFIRLLPDIIEKR